MQSGTVEAGNRIPFSKEHELVLISGDTIPGQPLIPHHDKTAVAEFLSLELSTARLESIYWMLFLVSKLRNISPLHHQLVKGRQIVITERPDLHLVWHYDRIFIKPVPKCLLSHKFWEAHLLPGPHNFTLRLEALGFLRTYASLVVHESDFELMKELRLIPDHIDWAAWCRFIQGFVHLGDSRVSPRYHYGELRLTRLNFWSFVFLGGQSYFKVCHNCVTYFARFGAPCLFIFGAVTVVVGALQCAVQVYPEGTYVVLASSFVPFSMVLTLIVLALFPLLYILFQIRELFLFIFRHRKLL
ncbi:hypothetical protein B0O99DRAFT_523972 [Bisporella sp. PMI_857]|nr:hypothetical protein B0O99DRAFT_523972 [Bisporella sp. PMI_857]